jgi:diaminohydroxyphosphoribosylaminopyrimidine deaminase/5-amino-6-(5-phosphoribosylamino)uracil reductase
MEKNHFMQQAMLLAAKARGRTSPNPMVGAVIVKGRRIIGKGYHKKAGTDHAEIIAIKKAGKRVKGSTLYVNLEPCCHREKRTPPCTDAIIRAGIKKVVVAMVDPNPMVSGKGIEKLRASGIMVDHGIMEIEAKRLNEAYIKFITTKKPFVILKIAQSIDGKIATANGESKWITCERARHYVHKLRNEVDAVLVGAGTVMKDNPLLTCRIKGGKNPYRIIVDSALKIPLNANVLRLNDGKTIIATTQNSNHNKIKKIISLGHHVIITKNKDGKVDLKALIKNLGRLDITSIMVEGGSSINASALQNHIVDKILLFIAPKIIGGVDSVPSIGGFSPSSLRKITKIKNIKIRKIGEDTIIEGYL